MKTTHILTMMALAAGTLATTSCEELVALAEKARGLQNGTATTALASATGTAPTTLAGKKLTLNYAAAQISNGDSSNYPRITWGPWQKLDTSNAVTPTFNSTNRAVKTGITPDESETWTYKKTGTSTAEASIEGYEYAETFHLTFETATTGTATGGTADDCNGYTRVKGIRFSIK